MPRTYKEVKKCPEELNKLLEPFNLLPMDLKKFENALMELSMQFNQDLQADTESYEKLLASLLRLYGAKFRKLIPLELEKHTKYSIVENGFTNVLFQVRRFINEKRMLLEIILAFNSW